MLLQHLLSPNDLLFTFQELAWAFLAMKSSKCPSSPFYLVIPVWSCLLLSIQPFLYSCLSHGTVNFEDRDCVFFIFASQQPAQV